MPNTTPAFPTWPEDAPLREYVGSCHCKQTQFRFTHPIFDDGRYNVSSCNCSICQMKGFLGVYVPEDRFGFTRGGFDKLTSYNFNKKVISHYFCPTCGVGCICIAGPMNVVAVNVRTLEGVELGNLKLKPFDGKSLP